MTMFYIEVSGMSLRKPEAYRIDVSGVAERKYLICKEKVDPTKKFGPGKWDMVLHENELYAIRKPSFLGEYLTTTPVEFESLEAYKNRKELQIDYFISLGHLNVEFRYQPTYDPPSKAESKWYQVKVADKILNYATLKEVADDSDYIIELVNIHRNNLAQEGIKNLDKDLKAREIADLKYRLEIASLKLEFEKIQLKRIENSLVTYNLVDKYKLNIKTEEVFSPVLSFSKMNLAQNINIDRERTEAEMPRRMSAEF
jgi:hypothetical protein